MPVLRRGGAASATVVESAREQVRDFATKRPKPKRKPWVQPTQADLADGVVIAFDQTFSKTGWALLAVWQGEARVVDKGVLIEKPTEHLTGHLDTLQRTEWMGQRILTCLEANFQRAIIEFPWLDVTVVHELPPVAGYRPESSLLGALCVRQACTKHSLTVVAVANQHMRAVLTEPHSDRVSKAPVFKALMMLGLTFGRSNADERDAIGLGLTYLYDRKKQA